jgi:hypothetical protein
MESTAQQESHEEVKSHEKAEGAAVPQEHPSYENISPEYVAAMTQPADRFLCKLSDNWCGFKFQGFSIRDEDSKLVLVNVPPSDD